MISALARASSPRNLLLAITLVWAAGMFFALRSSYWAYDDWLYFHLGDRDGFFSQAWLTSIYFQHFAPGHRALTSVVAQLMPLSYGWALVAFLGCLAGATLIFERCAAWMFGVRWVHVGAAVLLLVSLTHTSALIWWSAGLQLMPTLLLELTCLLGFLAYRATGRVRWHVLSIGALVVGLAFYIRPLLMAVYLLAVQIAFLSPSLRPRSLWDDLWARRNVWLGYALVCGTYGAYYYSRNQLGAAPPGDPVSLGSMLEYLSTAWTRNYAPSLLGVKVDQTATTAQDVAVILAQVAILALVVATVWRRRSALRAWVFLAVTGTVSLLVTSSRIANFGPEIGYDTRYMIELTWLFPLAACAALAPGLRALPERPSGAAIRLPDWRLAAPTVAGLALVSMLSGVSSRDEERAWAGAAARGYADNLRAGMRQLPDDTVLADREVPDEVMPAFSGLNQLSNVIAFIAPEATVDGPGTSLASVDDAGHPSPARTRVASGGPVGQGLGSGRLTVEGAAEQRRAGRALCVRARPDASARLLLRSAGPTIEGRAYVSATAAAGSAALSLPVFVDQGGGLAASVSETLDLRAGVPSMRWTQAANPRAVAVDVPAGRSICITELSVRIVVPA